jgi:hypothetical protein
MKTLRPLAQEQFIRAESRLLHPARGSKIEAAAAYGLDLTLLIEQLRLTPAQRAMKLKLASTELERARGVARRRS